MLRECLMPGLALALGRMQADQVPGRGFGLVRADWRGRYTIPLGQERPRHASAGSGVCGHRALKWITDYRLQFTSRRKETTQ